MTLLIHSMSEFSDIILHALQIAGVRHIAEVGAEFGGTSQQLAAYARVTDGSLTSIDPAPKNEFLAWVAQTPEVRHMPEASHDAMPKLSDIDAWVIDGDHNYYTVIEELRIANRLALRDGKHLFALMHDVSWPCARRDCYYAPDRIPAEHRHPYSYEAGVTLGDPQLHVNRGFRGCGSFAWALHEGGPRNGVLTAVEDFLEETRTEERPLAWAHVPAVFGLGILFDSSAPWAPALAEMIMPWHNNKLLHALETNRLSNYLAVIDWQDRTAARAAA